MAESLFSGAKVRNTRQKCSVLDCFITNSQNHLTVEDIVNYLDKSKHYVSKATVYRCVKNLLNESVIKKYKLNGRSSACYQYINEQSGCNSHCHLICSKCEKVTHFKSEKVLSFQKMLNETNGFLVDIPGSSFYGLCKACRKK